MTKKTCIAFIGPMLGRSSLRIPNPAEELATGLARLGYENLLLSPVRNKYIRFIHTLRGLLVNKPAIDILSIQVYSGLGLWMNEVVARLGQKWRIPIVMVLHGGGIPESVQRKPRFCTRLFSRANVLVTPSHFIAAAIEPYGINPQVIPNGIETCHYPFRLRAKPNPQIAWLRAFHRIYDPCMAVEALSIILKRFHSASLAMIGPDKNDGSLKAVKALARQRGIEEHIKICGAVPRSQVAKYLSEYDIYLNTTLYESFGVSVMEAAACGMCIVTTDPGELPFTWKHGEDALLVPVKDAEAMALAVSHYLTEPELAERASRKARRKAEEYDWREILPRWDKLYKGLL